MFNKVIVVGKPVKPKFFAPKNNQEQDGGICYFGIACNHLDQNKDKITDWINIKLIGASNCNNLKKAIEANCNVVIDGVLQTTLMKNKDTGDVTPGFEIVCWRLSIIFNPKEPKVEKTDLSQEPDIPF